MVLLMSRKDRHWWGLSVKNDVKIQYGLVCLKDFVKGIRVKIKVGNGRSTEKFSSKMHLQNSLQKFKWWKSASRIK